MRQQSNKKPEIKKFSENSRRIATEATAEKGKEMSVKIQDYLPNGEHSFNQDKVFTEKELREQA